jgi:U4/U6.U5 tri-snRNP-associated protein 2
MNNKNSFKSHLTPQIILNLITDLSEKKFKIDTKNDPLEFLIWFLNELHYEFLDKKTRSTKKNSFITKLFQGEIFIKSYLTFVKDKEIIDEKENINPFL